MPRRKQKTIAAHPGEILRTEFMEPMGVTAISWARRCIYPASTRSCAGSGPSAPTSPCAWANNFGVTPQFWMNLQTDYGLRIAATSAPLNKIKPRKAA